MSNMDIHISTRRVEIKERMLSVSMPFSLFSEYKRGANSNSISSILLDINYGVYEVFLSRNRPDQNIPISLSSGRVDSSFLAGEHSLSL